MQKEQQKIQRLHLLAPEKRFDLVTMFADKVWEPGGGCFHMVNSDLFRNQLIYLLQVTTLLRPVLSNEITFSAQTERTAEQKTALLPSAPSKDCLPKTILWTTHKTSPDLNFFLCKNPTIYKRTASPDFVTFPYPFWVTLKNEYIQSRHTAQRTKKEGEK